MNLAQALFKQEQYRACVTECTNALALRADNVKALYRRAMALVRAEVQPSSLRRAAPPPTHIVACHNCLAGRLRVP